MPGWLFQVTNLIAVFYHEASASTLGCKTVEEVRPIRDEA
jgi:hypothetical protein